MNPIGRNDITGILPRAALADSAAAAELLRLVYDELRNLADAYLRRDRVGHTLQPTALVHEAFLRLVNDRAVAQMDRTHFFAVAATVMRRVLIDHARAGAADKRGGRLHRITLDSELLAVDQANIDLAALDEALEKLGALDERLCRVVELRFFGRLSVAETAEYLGVSKRTVEGDWELARAWLHRELTKG